MSFTKWGQLSTPIFAGDNTLNARALSASIKNRPPAKPTGRPIFSTHRDVQNQNRSSK